MELPYICFILPLPFAPYDQWSKQPIIQHLPSSIDNTALLNAPFGPGTGPIYLDNLACVGTEPTLTNCTHDTHTADCVHSEDASVRCSSTRKQYCL